MSFPPPTTAEPTTPTKIKPGKVWYVIGALVLAVGIIGGVVLGVVGVVRFMNTVEDFGRFRVVDGRGEATVTFEKPGEYAIYYESKSKVCEDLTAGSDCTKTTVRADGNPPQLDITISRGGTNLEVDESNADFDYDFGGDYAGTEIATVDVDEPGEYAITVETRREGEFVIAIGKGVLSSLLPWIIGAGALVVAGLVLGVITIVVTAVKRSRRKRDAALAASDAFPAAPGSVPPATFGTPPPPGADVPPPPPVDVPPRPADPPSPFAPQPDGGWATPPATPPTAPPAPPAPVVPPPPPGPGAPPPPPPPADSGRTPLPPPPPPPPS
jgi:hypothetical protein